jgi:cytochrome c oxidase cbb3-type subunit III
MKYQIAFWMLVMSAILLVAGIFVMAGAIKTILYRRKIQDELNKKKSEQSGSGLKALITILLAGIGSSLFAQGGPEDPIFEPAMSDILGLAIINLILLFVYLYFRSIFNNLVKELIPEKEGKQYQPSYQLNKLLTDAVEIEDEASILMDHEYDGIRELDNNLPPWWKWGFYATIVFAVVYLAHYHVFKTGDLQEAEYEKEMAEAQIAIDAYNAEMAWAVDENTVTFLSDIAELNAGKSIYLKNCASCHMEDGTGGIGVNLTDNDWLYGNSINEIFKTITYGAQNGMKSWKEDLNPIERQQVSSYVFSLTNKEGGETATEPVTEPIINDTLTDNTPEVTVDVP